MAQHHGWCAALAHKLAAAWSPKQISGWLTIASPDATHMHLSHETVYSTLYVQTRSAVRREITAKDLFLPFVSEEPAEQNNLLSTYRRQRTGDRI